MKILKNIVPLFFLLLSVGCAVLTAIKTEKIQREFPGGVLAVLYEEEKTKPDFLIIEKKNGSPLYKNGAIEEIRKKYGITVSEEQLIEMDSIKSLLSQSWKLFLAGVYFLVMLCAWKAAVGYIVIGYTEYKNQKIFKTTVRIFSGAFLYLASVGIWYLMIRYIDIPQQYLPLGGIWDVGYIVDEIKEFYRESEEIANTVSLIAEIRAVGNFTMRRYMIAIMLFIPFWIRILFLTVKSKNI